MGKRRRYLPPSEVEILRLGDRGVGLGFTSAGHPIAVRGAAPGSRVSVQPSGRRKGVWRGRRVNLIRPPAEFAIPPCAAFGLCGGCTLQELSLRSQREHKMEFALSEVDKGLSHYRPRWRDEVNIHPIRGTQDTYGYRNKVELSFGTRRYLDDAQMAEGLPFAGRFVGFHPPGRFDRVVDLDRCWLIGESSNTLLQSISDAVKNSRFEPYDAQSHQGYWRHLLLRESPVTGECLVGIYTTTPADSEASDEMIALAERLMAIPLPDGRRLVGIVWIVNDGVADVARGAIRHTWGRSWMMERLGKTEFRLSPASFFQTSTHGAVVLYDTVLEAVGDHCEVLYDLYCGVGSIGLYLANHVGRIIGIEEVEEAVEDARENARRNLVENVSYKAAKVEDALSDLSGVDGDSCLIVDPPRAGLHPKVARALAAAETNRLIYVACKPASLGRDAAILEAGGWRLRELWAVDLFPQTGHIELVGRFER